MGYAPHLARWMSQDPIGVDGVDLLDAPPTTNLYTYGENNPANRVDPSGLWCAPLTCEKGETLIYPRGPKAGEIGTVRVYEKFLDAELQENIAKAAKDTDISFTRKAPPLLDPGKRVVKGLLDVTDYQIRCCKTAKGEIRTLDKKAIANPSVTVSVTVNKPPGPPARADRDKYIKCAYQLPLIAGKQLNPDTQGCVEAWFPKTNYGVKSITKDTDLDACGK